MTPSEKDAVRRIRENGGSYGQIASTLGLSENTVKSFWRRMGVQNSFNQITCPRCRKHIISGSRGQHRRFCSDTCRYAWDYTHRVLSEKNAISKRCACCDQPFFSYPSSGRKYCSRTCYVRDRFVREARHGSRAV